MIIGWAGGNMKTCTAFVTYNKHGNYDWTKICVRSYRMFMDDVPLFVVDHNNNLRERMFLDENKVEIIENTHRPHTHGDGLDVAADYAKRKGFDSIVFIEPDCVFSVTGWYKNITKALDSGCSMAATYKHNFGPMHPCGSGWIIEEIPTSFKIANKTESETSSKTFQKEMKLKVLCEYMMKSISTEEFHFFLYQWDVGGKNWFMLEEQNKTKKVDPDGFKHFWGSHRRTPESVMNISKANFEMISHWISDTIKLY